MGLPCKPASPLETSPATLLSTNPEDKGKLVAIERKIFRDRQQTGGTELLAIYLLFSLPMQNNPEDKVNQML